VIIVDWHMEPLDGLDFVRLVRTAKNSPNPYVPIIMLSSYTEHQRITEARDAGINEFRAKPISVKSIYQRIAMIIDNPRPFIRSKNILGRIVDARTLAHHAMWRSAETTRPPVRKQAVGVSRHDSTSENL